MFPDDIDSFPEFVDARLVPVPLSEKHVLPSKPDSAGYLFFYLNEAPYSQGKNMTSVTILGLASQCKEVFSAPMREGEFLVDYRSGKVSVFDNGTARTKEVSVSYNGKGTVMRASVLQNIADSIVRTQTEILKLKAKLP